MKKLIFVLIIALSVTSSYAKETVTKINCSEIGNYLHDCIEMECTTINNMKQKVWQKISGLDKKGRCIHEQKISDRKTIKCKYSEESRKFMALQIINAKMEPNRKINQKIKEREADISGKNYEPSLIKEIFQHECKVKEGY